MNAVLMMVKRDIRNSLNRRFFLMLAFLLLFQVWFTLTSGSPQEVMESGQMFYMAAVFSFNFVGSLVALAMSSNGISRERESKFLDLILTSGVSKGKVYLSKLVAAFISSGVFAVLYTLAMALVYLLITGDLPLSLLMFQYVLPISSFLSIFTLMGLLLSVILRSSKTSLITALMIGALLMPRLFVMTADGLGNALGIPQTVIDILYLISPAMIMNALNGYSDLGYTLLGLLFLALYLILLAVAGTVVFARQDELNYGE